MPFYLGLTIVLLIAGLIMWIYSIKKAELDAYEDYINKYEAELNARKDGMDDYYSKLRQHYKKSTVVTEDAETQTKDGIITDGEHAGRKFSKSNNRKRSDKKSVFIETPKPVETSTYKLSTYAKEIGVTPAEVSVHVIPDNLTREVFDRTDAKSVKEEGAKAEAIFKNSKLQNPKSKNKSNKDDKGFALIELMIVIAIIALVAAIIIPAIKGAQTCSDNNDKYCRSNVITTSNGLKIGCVNGIMYFLNEKLVPSTPVIDPETKDPKSCEVEKL